MQPRRALGRSTRILRAFVIPAASALLATCSRPDAPTAASPTPPEAPSDVGVPPAGPLSVSSPEAGPLSPPVPFGALSNAVPGLGALLTADRATTAQLTDAVGVTHGIVWQDTVSGDRSIWHMQGTTWPAGNAYTLLPRVDTKWRIVASGDFDGDGDADLVWQRDSLHGPGTADDRRYTSIWLMQGTAWPGGNAYALLPSVPARWKIGAAADFTGDGMVDLVWQDTVSGDRSIWHMQGTRWPGGNAYTLLPNVPPAWEIVAAADLTGQDGKADLVWQRDTAHYRQTSVWRMNHTTWPGGTAYLLVPRPNGLVPRGWEIAAAADYTGGGDPDLVWQNLGTGERSIWEMRGPFWDGAYTLLKLPDGSNVPARWQIATHFRSGTPAAPSGATAIARSGSDILVTWTDASTDEAGFRVERCTGAGCTDFVEYFVITFPDIRGLEAGDHAPSTAYSYRVRAYNDVGNSAYSNVATVMTPAAPLVPTNLTATPSPTGTSQIDLTWTDTSNDEDGFQIWRCTGAGCVNPVEVGRVGAGVTSYQDRDLAPSTTYRYTVQAFNAAGVSGRSAPATATTPPAPNAPTNLVATTRSTTHIDLAWTDNSANELGFRVEHCIGDTCENFTEVAITGRDATSAAITGLLHTKTYRFRVRSYNAAGASEYSNTVTAATARLFPPLAPAGVTANALSSARIRLEWVDNNTQEDGYRIERCTGASCTSLVLIAELGPNATSFLDIDLTASTTYRYSVRAYNALGTAASAVVSATTGAATIPNAPSDLSAIAQIEVTIIDLMWTDNADNEVDFVLERCTGAACTNFAQRAIVGRNGTSYQDLGVSRGTAYRYRVRARNAVGTSAPSNISSATAR